jgi:hypothetical protein
MRELQASIGENQGQMSISIKQTLRIFLTICGKYPHPDRIFIPHIPSFPHSQA